MVVLFAFLFDLLRLWCLCVLGLCWLCCLLYGCFIAVVFFVARLLYCGSVVCLLLVKLWLFCLFHVCIIVVVVY